MEIDVADAVELIATNLAGVLSVAAAVLLVIVLLRAYRWAGLVLGVVGAIGALRGRSSDERRA